MSFVGIAMSKSKLNNRLYSIQNKKIKMDPFSDQGCINYISLPSLQNAAILNIVTTLWKQPDLSEAMWEHITNFQIAGGYLYAEKRESFNRIEERVSKKLSLLSLPDLLKAKVYTVIRPVGFQLLNWMDFMKQNYIDFNNTSDTCWTRDGIIDKAKTLESCFVRESLERHVCFFYSLACKYCSKDFVCNLWKKMSENCKDEIKRQISCRKFDDIVLYWTCFVKNELSNFSSMINTTNQSMYNEKHSIYQNMFKLSITIGNSSATKYFWQYLTFEEKNSNIEKWTDAAAYQRQLSTQYDYQKTNEHTDILCFLLSQMNDKEQQKRVLQKYSDFILEWLFLDWPWQKFLLPTIQAMWEYLDGHVFVKLLCRISSEINESRDTEKILRDLWRISPKKYKSEFLETLGNSVYSSLQVFWKLLETKDFESLKFILNDATPEKKNQIMFAIIKYKDKLFKLIYANNLVLLDTLIAENLSLQSEIDNFRESVILSVGAELCHLWLCDNKWLETDNLLKWGFSTQDQITNFKSNIINKTEIVSSLIYLDNYELADKFLSWCFNSEEEMCQFKKYLAYCNDFETIKEIKDLNSLNNLMYWCFKSDVDVSQFKKVVSQSDELKSILFYVIVYRYNFKFANEILSWCLNHKEEINQFKTELILSDLGMEIFVTFITNHIIYDSKYSNWKLVEKLTKWYYPLEEDVIVQFKKKVKNVKQIIFGEERCSPFYSAKGKEQALFHLLDVFAKKNHSNNASSDLRDTMNDNDSDDSLNSDAAHMLNILSDNSDCSDFDEELDILIQFV